ncbi:substrate-binding periplasmic protein [Paucibacter sp. KCTC 42545]|uniref:substrate-binding periplasmic protein n=1 Tax=Paucibacter sp. KCTC 42545 TaxID=1768242 RepID=UPI000733B25B|nr:transporter substrate-binding domain-containing protein [Paucibacter sp. KCTC 42545]ALT77827.1 hypothetical protein AT984_12185 [Paucibacter sp. KCTC 42545]
MPNPLGRTAQSALALTLSHGRFIRDRGLQLLLLVLGLLQTPAMAAPSVQLCLTEFPPFNSQDLPGRGPLIEIAVEAFRRSGSSVEVHFLPWARLMKEAEEAKCAILGLWRNEARDRLFAYSQPIMQMELGYFGKRGSASDPSGPKTAGGQSICTQRGSYLSPALQQLDLRFEPVLDLPTCLRMLAKDRVDLAYGNKALGMHFLNQAANREIAALVQWKSPELESKDHLLAVLKTDPRRERILRDFNRGLASMRADGSYKTILKAGGLGDSP